MIKSKYSLILASQSPRRKELLNWLGIPFTVYSMGIEENSFAETPKDFVMDLAKQKGIAVYKDCINKHAAGSNFFPLVVAADTVVVAGEKEILGRPKDRNMAREMLLKLSGETHQVFTGVYIGCKDINTGLYKEELFYCRTAVTFASIDEDLLDNYLETGDALDKAGAYGIQGPALTFITSVIGSYSNVVGFPLSDFVSRLKSLLGYQDDKKGEWREVF